MLAALDYCLFLLFFFFASFVSLDIASIILLLRVDGPPVLLSYVFRPLCREE